MRLRSWRGGLDTVVIPETEQDFKSWVLDLAKRFNWRVCHFRAARVLKDGQETYRTPVEADGAGFPDLVLVRPPKCLFVELKSQAGKVSSNQERWLRELSSCPGIAVCVWRPADRDRIEGKLR